MQCTYAGEDGYFTIASWQWDVGGACASLRARCYVDGLSGACGSPRALEGGKGAQGGERDERSGGRGNASGWALRHYSGSVSEKVASSVRTVEGMAADEGENPLNTGEDGVPLRFSFIFSCRTKTSAFPHSARAVEKQVKMSCRHTFQSRTGERQRSNERKRGRKRRKGKKKRPGQRVLFLCPRHVGHRSRP